MWPTVYKIFTVRNILEKFWEQDYRCKSSIVDFQEAYDTVWWKEIWSKMHKLGFARKYVKLCKILNNEAYARFKISKHLSFEFKVNKVGNKEM